MRKHNSKFTLVEMLTVIAIIGVLAAVVTPAVILARQRGMVTGAQSDIKSIMAGLKQMEADYGKVLKKDGTNYKIGNTTVASTKIDNNKVATLDGDAYNAMIAELSAPKNTGLTVSVNKRKKVYLDPRKEFDPAVDYKDQTDALWRDPWGSPYMIYIKTTKDDEITLPGSMKPGDETKRLVITGNFAVYSFGPNKADEKGCNADLESCSYKGASGNHRNHDDIASWQL